MIGASFNGKPYSIQQNHPELFDDKISKPKERDWKAEKDLIIMALKKN
jgi:hypothetical protein